VNDAPAHEHIEELLAAEAVGGLDDEGRRELARALDGHPADCPDCARLRSAYGEVAASLALSLDPVPAREGAEDELWRRAQRTRGGARAIPGGGATPRRARPSGERGRGFGAAVAAVAAAMVLLAGLVGYLLHGAPGPETAISDFFAHAGAQSAQMHSGATTMTVYYRPGQTSAFAVGSGFADAPPGHVYELWYRPAGATAMAPAGTFVPKDGSVVSPVRVGTDIDLLAVSVEPGFETTPTGPVVLSGPVPPPT
jgi:hypothetical protein